MKSSLQHSDVRRWTFLFFPLVLLAHCQAWAATTTSSTALETPTLTKTPTPHPGSQASKNKSESKPGPKNNSDALEIPDSRVEPLTYQTLPAEKSKAKKKKILKLFAAPLGAYKDTYGFIGGIAVILYDPKTQTRLNNTVNSNFDQYFRDRLKFELVRPGEWIDDCSGYLGNDLQSYYGNGDQTTTVHHSHKSSLNGAQFDVLRHVIGNLYIGPSLEYRNRKWDDANLNQDIFRNESEWRIGLQNRWEGRDNIVAPRKGYFGELDVYALPNAQTQGFGAKVWQVEGDVRAYRPLWKGSVWASRLYVANTFGTPSYSYDYTLGGTSRLRGYLSNRFRGKRCYVAQTETRFNIWKWFGADTGFDLGDATDTRFSSTPKWSYQAGLRTSLLEKFGVVVRMEWGWSKDQHNFYFNTYEPF